MALWLLSGTALFEKEDHIRAAKELCLDVDGIASAHDEVASTPEGRALHDAQLP